MSETTSPAKPKRRFVVFPDTNGQWRWSEESTANGQVVCNGALVTDRNTAIRTAKREMALYPPGFAEVVVLTEVQAKFRREKLASPTRRIGRPKEAKTT